MSLKETAIRESLSIHYNQDNFVTPRSICAKHNSLELIQSLLGSAVQF